MQQYFTYNIISLSIELVLGLICFISCEYHIFKKGLKDEIPYQLTFLILGLVFSIIRVSMLLFAEINYTYLYSRGLEDLSPFLNVNLRIIIVFLSFYEITHLILYYTKFRFVRAIRISDKIFFIVFQIALYLTPILFTLAIYINTYNHNFDLTPYYKSYTTILVLIHQLPELEIANTSIVFLYFIFIILALIPIKTINKKNKFIKASYIVFIMSIIYRLVCAKLTLMSSDLLLLLNTIYRYSLNISVILFYIFIFFMSRGDSNDRTISE